MKQATITKINKDKIIAIIKADSMCAHCSSSSNCMIKECAKKEVIIHTNNASNHKVGDVINLNIDNKNSFLALFFAYILPLFILLTIFFLLSNFNVEETQCGIFSIISLIPYYFLLFLFKNKLANTIKIEIHDN